VLQVEMITHRKLADLGGATSWNNHY